MAIIAPAENHAAVVGADQAAVGDGDAMRVAPEIGENVLASAERRLGIDNPVLTAKPPHCRSKDIGVVELGERAREAQTTAQVRRLETFEEQPPEQAREHMNGQEEARPAGEPALAVRERAAGPETVDMRVVVERLPPAVEDGEEADLAAQMSRVGRNDLERRDHGIEQDRPRPYCGRLSPRPRPAP